MKRARGPAVVLVLMLGLAGCSGGSNPAPVALPTLGTATPTAAGTATPSAWLPPSALPDTVYGLDAFVRYYFAQLNRAFSTSDPQIIRALSDPRCTTCENYAKSLEDQGTFIKGESFGQVDVAVPPLAAGGTVVEINGLIPARQLVDRTGKILKPLPAEGRFHFQANVLRVAGGWRVRGIRIAT